MPDIPDIFGVTSRCRVHAYVWKKATSPALNLQKMLDIVYAYVWYMRVWWGVWYSLFIKNLADNSSR